MGSAMTSGTGGAATDDNEGELWCVPIQNGCRAAQIWADKILLVFGGFSVNGGVISGIRRMAI